MINPHSLPTAKELEFHERKAKNRVEWKTLQCKNVDIVSELGRSFPFIISIK